MTNAPPDDDNLSLYDVRKQTEKDRQYAEQLQAYFAGSLGAPLDKLRNFAKYVPRQVLTTYLARYELFKKVLDVHGAFVECGVFLGHGLMTWANLSAIFEPYHHVRRIIGFDTFAGFSTISEEDLGDNTDQAIVGGMAASAYDDLQECIRLYDLNRPIGHIPRVELVKGDAVQTIPQYARDNKHLVVALLYLDFDVYEPTKAALETFLPYMPKGAVIAFDELNQAAWPGETLAVFESVGLRNLRIQRFPFASALSYAMLD